MHELSIVMHVAKTIDELAEENFPVFIGPSLGHIAGRRGIRDRH